ncbi:SixA phosphatase family protein [Pilimelia columellifera]|uniref:Histidine phosphatase family protein n=1 Tax=Pilimelia columellifera subsp. columellifera TaxID=706583 RepID=A0ABN3N110_9ACTN
MTDATIVLLRHAKADRPTDLPDADRPLTPRGHADAAAAGAWLVKNSLRPELVLCSPARRTRQTWHGVAVALGNAASPTARYVPDIYEASASDLLGVLREVDAGVGTVLLVGHNPGISLLSTLLAPSAAGGDGLRTCGLAVHRPRVEWSRLGSGDAELALSHTARG